MTRFGICTALAMTTLMMLGCGGASTPPPPPTAAPAGQAAPLAGKEKNNDLVLSEDIGHKDPSVIAVCTGTVPAFRVKVMRNQKFRWHIKNDNFNGCPNPDYSMVELVFTRAIWVDDANPTGPPVDFLTANQGAMNQIVARVHSSAPFGVAGYFVRYKGLKASPDPEVDVDGTCGDCGEGSAR